MVKLLEAMRQKDIPFSFLVSDMPTYMVVTQPKAENHHPFKDIVPILGAFHQQMSYIYAIYKIFKGSGMADTLVTAGVVAEEPVDQALKGRHYRLGLRRIILWREALIYMPALAKDPWASGSLRKCQAKSWHTPQCSHRDPGCSRWCTQ